MYPYSLINILMHDCVKS